MKILAGKNKHSLVFPYFLFRITPLARQLHRRLHSFSTTVHKETLLVAEHLTDILLGRTKLIIVKGPRGQGQFLCLIDQRIDDTWMAVTLVNCAISRKKIVITFPCEVPHENPFATGKDHGQGMIIMSAILVLQRHSLPA